MTSRNSVLTFVVSSVLAISLAACGSQQASEANQKDAPAQDAAVAEQEVAPKFITGHAKRDIKELDDIVTLKEIRERCEKLKDEVPEKAEDGDLAKSADKAFTNANKEYAAGNYDKAVSGYQDAIKTYPLHLGANVNLTLALLQQQKNEEALAQALICAHLFPKDSGCILNAQVACVANGFSFADLKEPLRKSVSTFGGTSALSRMSSDKNKKLYEYNELWDEIETTLYNGDNADDDRPLSIRFQDVRIKLKDLAEDHGKDPDVQALRAYLDSLGAELGWVVDASAAEAVRELPAVILDDEMCKVEITDVSWNPSKGMTVKYTLTSRNEDGLSIKNGDGWMIDGEPAYTEWDGHHLNSAFDVDGSFGVKKGTEDSSDEATSNSKTSSDKSTSSKTTSNSKSTSDKATSNSKTTTDSKSTSDKSADDAEPKDLCGVLCIADDEGKVVKVFPFHWAAGA